VKTGTHKAEVGAGVETFLKSEPELEPKQIVLALPHSVSSQIRPGKLGIAVQWVYIMSCSSSATYIFEESVRFTLFFSLTILKTLSISFFSLLCCSVLGPSPHIFHCQVDLLIHSHSVALFLRLFLLIYVLCPWGPFWGYKFKLEEQPFCRDRCVYVRQMCL
jgi:hypothetical protein